MNVGKLIIKSLLSFKTGEKGKLVKDLLYLLINMRRITDCGFIALDYNPDRKNDEFSQLRKVLSKSSKFSMSTQNLADVFNYGVECGFFNILKTQRNKGNLMRVRFSINSTRDSSNYIKIHVDENTTKTQLMYSISKILILDKIQNVQNKVNSISKSADGAKKPNHNATTGNCMHEKFKIEYNVISYDTFDSLVFVGRTKVIEILKALCSGQHCLVEKRINKFDIPDYLDKDFLIMSRDIYSKVIQKANGEGFFIQIANKWVLTGEGERYLKHHRRNYHRASRLSKRYKHMAVEIKPQSKDPQADSLFNQISKFYAKMSKRKNKYDAPIKLPISYMKNNPNFSRHNIWNVRYYSDGILDERITDNIILKGWNVSDEQRKLFKSRIEEIKMSINPTYTSYTIKDVLIEVGIGLDEIEKKFIARSLSPIESKICNDYRNAIKLPLKHYM